MKNIDKKLNAARIAKINEAVTNNSTLSPYMLFPLRLETHFREAEVSNIPSYEIEKIDLISAFEQFIEDLIKPHASFSIEESLYDLRTKIDELDLLSPEDKTVIISISSYLKSFVTSLFEEEDLDRIYHYLYQIQKAADNIETSSSLKNNPATIFLRDLEANYKSLTTLSEYTKTPYRSTDFYAKPENIKAENIRLYRYVTGRVYTIASFFKRAIKEFDKLPSLNNHQRGKIIDGLHTINSAKWNRLFSNIAANMAKVYEKESFQAEKLLEKYDKEWKSALASAEKEFSDFSYHINSNINKKPRNSFSFINLAQLVLQLKLELLQARTANRYIPYKSLIKKIDRLMLKSEKTFIDYSRQKDLLVTLSLRLRRELTEYLNLMKRNKYADYNSYAEFDTLLKKIKTNHLSEQKVQKESFVKQKQLCVRVFPDEVFIHQHDKLLSEEEAEDGREFWLRWYIASGLEIHEKEAWNRLWRKHGVMRASWIVRSLRPLNLPSYDNMEAAMKNSKSIVYNRPYKDFTELKSLIKQFDQNLLKISNIRGLRRNLQADLLTELEVAVDLLVVDLLAVQKNIAKYSKFVDYIYDDIASDINYFKRRIRVALRGSLRRLNRVANTRLNSQIGLLIKIIGEIKSELDKKKISLQDLTAEYQSSLDKNKTFFPQIKEYRDPDDISGPYSAIMPDRFLFVGDTKLKINRKNIHKRIIHAGRKVKRDLALSIDFNENDEINPFFVDEKTGEMELRGGIKWMTDYETAVKSGMAITIPLPHDDENFRKASFSAIYVFGVKSGAGKEVLKDFLNGHIYGQSGLDFLKIGTPTNSIDEEIISGYNSDEDKLEQRRFEIDVEHRFENVNSALYRSLVYAFGVDNSFFNDTLARVNSHDNQEIQNAKFANRLLSDAFGFNQSLGVTSTQKKFQSFLEQIPEFVSTYGMARGLIPPLRIGSQPYGIMPTTAFSRFAFETEGDSHIKNNDKDFHQFAKQLYLVLKHLTNIWIKLKDKHVIHSGNLGSKEPEKRYLEMMGLTPVSESFFERTLIQSSDLLHPVINYKGLESKDYKIAKMLKDIFEIEVPKSSANSIIYDDIETFNFHPIAGLVKELKNVVNDEPDLKAFVGVLFSQENLNKLKKFVPEKEIPLLVIEFMDLFTYRLDAWWMGLVNYQLHRIRKTNNFGELGNDTSIGAYGWLFNLERRQRGKVLGASEHRRVSEKMNLGDKETPIYKDADNNEFILAPSINHAITAAVLRSSYVNHSHKSNSGEITDSRLCINLSSARVRQALRILEGIRNGLSVGMVLGADLERSMHEAYKTNNVEFDRYIYHLREMFPMKIDIKSEQEGPEAKNYIMTLINGDLLLGSVFEAYEEHRTISIADYLIKKKKVEWFEELFKDRPENHKKVMARLIEQIADSYDALSDLIVSEGVYQLVQGNRVAFSALMSNMKEGKIYTEPEIPEIPMRSAVVRHNVALALKAEADTNLPGWNRSLYYKNTKAEDVIEICEWMMSEAEPSLNQWIAGLLGHGDKQLFTVTFFEANNELNKRVISLSELAISPLEYFYLSSNNLLFKRYLELMVRKKYNWYNGAIEIDMKSRDSSWSSEKRNLFENEWIIGKIRSMVANAKALDAEHFSTTAAQTDNPNQKGLMLDELKARYNRLLKYCESTCNRLKKLHTAYSAIVEARPDTLFIQEEEIEEIVDLLLEAASIGVMEALTTLPENLFANKNRETDKLKQQDYLLVSLNKSYMRLISKINAAKELVATDAESTTEDKVSDYTAAIRELLVSDFVVIPHFNLSPLADKDKNDLAIQIEEDFSFKNLSSMDIEQWTGETAKVREVMTQLHQVRMFAELSGGTAGEIKAVQLPLGEESDKEWEWLGREVSSEHYVDDRDSFVIFNSEFFNGNNEKPMAGLLLDNWMELIPYEHQHGGVVFKYDQPNAEAPQVILLAVPAKITMRQGRYNRYQAKKWDLDDLIATFNDTRMMTEIRAVEPDHIYADEALSKILPLLTYKKAAVK